MGNGIEREIKVKKQTRITGPDIERDRSLDFSDDGTRFEGYMYKRRIPITRAAGTGLDECFICIRRDYTNEIPREEWNLCDYFNGVPRDKYNRETLVAICEYLYQKYFEKNPNPDKSELPGEFRD